MKSSTRLDPNQCPFWIERKGISYRLVMSTAKIALYRSTYVNNCTIEWFEVFRIYFNEERVFMGKLRKRSMRFPHDEAFGYWAWSYGSLDQAIRKMIELIFDNKRGVYEQDK